MLDDTAPNWGIEPVPDRLRVLGFVDTTLLWTNLGISLLVLVLPAYFDLSLQEALAATLVGGVIGNSMLAAAALIGADVGYLLPTLFQFGFGSVLVLSRGVDPNHPELILTAIAGGGAAAALALLALTVDETDEAFANVYSSAVSTQNLFPRVSQRTLIVGASVIATAGAPPHDKRSSHRLLLPPR